MGRIIRTLPEGSRVAAILADERFLSPMQTILPPGAQGFEPIRSPVRRLSVMSIVTAETAANLYGAGYEVEDPFVMDARLLNPEEDPRVERIRAAFAEFIRRVDGTFRQDEDEFVADPQFFNVANFVAENQFAISLFERLVDVRNAVVWRADKLQQRANQLLVLSTIRGATPSNLGSLRLWWDRLLAEGDPAASLDTADGMARIAVWRASAVLDTNRRRSPDGEILTNGNASNRAPVLAVRRHMTLPSETASGRPSAGGLGVVVVMLTEQTPPDRTPYMMLSPSAQRPTELRTPPISPMTYLRAGTRHATMLSARRPARPPQTGVGKGGFPELQPRTPVRGMIDLPSTPSVPDALPEERIVRPAQQRIFQVVSGEGVQEAPGRNNIDLSGDGGVIRDLTFR